MHNISSTLYCSRSPHSIDPFLVPICLSVTTRHSKYRSKGASQLWDYTLARCVIKTDHGKAQKGTQNSSSAAVEPHIPPLLSFASSPVASILQLMCALSDRVGDNVDCDEKEECTADCIRDFFHNNHHLGVLLLLLILLCPIYPHISQGRISALGSVPKCFGGCWTMTMPKRLFPSAKKSYDK